MAVTGTRTNREICTEALTKLGVVAGDMNATAEEMETARTQLDRMLKAWQNRGVNLWGIASQSVALTTAASYTLSPVRPLEILSCRYKSNGYELPMQSMTRDEYDRLPVKTSTGIPTTYYYDRQREAALLYIWPVLASATSETLEITYARESEDVDLDAVVDLPGEWWDAAVYGLASRLADDFQVNHPGVVARAEVELDKALAYDHEGSVWFCGDY